jgi:hypothetical protein
MVKRFTLGPQSEHLYRLCTLPLDKENIESFEMVKVVTTGLTGMTSYPLSNCSSFAAC